MIRYARYAAAALFALLAVGLVTLWVRSYHRADAIAGAIGERNYFWVSSNGVITAGDCHDPPSGWVWQSQLACPSPLPRWRNEVLSGLGFSFFNDSWGLLIGMPHWFLAASSLAVAALLAFKPITRFTIRGLLITTTLLAAVLGLAVYAL
jgi:hypothetical protein